jgi:hypothetical protein
LNNRNAKDQTMRTRPSTLLAALAVIGLVGAPAAHAGGPHDWRGRGHYSRAGHYGYHHQNGGDVAAGALIGLGVGALVGGAIVAAQQPYYAPPPVPYAPPPAYYPPPAYAPAPGY